MEVVSGSELIGKAESDLAENSDIEKGESKWEADLEETADDDRTESIRTCSIGTGLGGVESTIEEDNSNELLLEGDFEESRESVCTTGDK